MDITCPTIVVFHCDVRLTKRAFLRDQSDHEMFLPFLKKTLNQFYVKIKRIEFLQDQMIHQNVRPKNEKEIVKFKSWNLTNKEPVRVNASTPFQKKILIHNKLVKNKNKTNTPRPFLLKKTKRTNMLIINFQSKTRIVLETFKFS